MAYPIFQQAGTIGAAGDFSVDVPYTSTVNADDILIASLLDADNDAFDVPDGWTKIGEVTAHTNLSSAFYWKRANGTETGSVTFTSLLNAGSLVAGIMYRFSGCVKYGVPFDSAEVGWYNTIETWLTEVFNSNVRAQAKQTLIDNMNGVNRLYTIIHMSEDNTMSNLVNNVGTDWTEESNLSTAFGSDAHFMVATAEGFPTMTRTNYADWTGNEYQMGVHLTLIPEGDVPVTLNTADAHDFGDDLTPTVEFTGDAVSNLDVEYEVQFDTINSFDSQKVVTGLDISFSSGNYNEWYNQTALIKHAQSFIGNGDLLTGIRIAMARTAGFTGTMTFEIWSHDSGSYAGTGKPDTLLETVYSLDVSTLPVNNNVTMREFVFTTNFQTINGGHYWWALSFTGYNGLEGGRLGKSTNGDFYGSNCKYITSTWGTPSSDTWIFELIGSGAPLLHKGSELPNLTFTNTTDGADTHPFDDNEKVDYTLPSTYHWAGEDYPMQNRSSNYATSVTYNGAGQSFVGTGQRLHSAAFFLKKVGTPTGTMSAKLYAHSGTFGTSSVPTGTALATATLSASLLNTTEYAIWEFEFATPYFLEDGVNYVVTIEYPKNATNYINIGVDTSSSTHSGNISAFQTGWSAVSSEDLIFYLRYRLGYNTYYWRARAKNPTGINVWDDWTYETAEAVNTYYFDGSDVAATDDGTDWSNVTNADDGSISTLASTFNQLSSSIWIEGTNYTGGENIDSVRVRGYGRGATGSSISIKVYENGGTTLLGTANITDNTIQWYGYADLTEHSGGWTAAKIQALEVAIATGSGIGGGDIYKVEIEVTIFPIRRTFTLTEATGAIAGVVTTASSTDGILKGKGKAKGRSDSNRIAVIESNTANSIYIGGIRERLGQALLNYNNNVNSIKFLMYRGGSPVHDIKAVIYSLSSGLPNSVLQTSTNVIAASSITTLTAGAWYEFFFDGTTNYNQDIAVVIELTNVTTSNSSNRILARENYDLSESLVGKELRYNGTIWSDYDGFDLCLDVIAKSVSATLSQTVSIAGRSDVNRIIQELDNAFATFRDDANQKFSQVFTGFTGIPSKITIDLLKLGSPDHDLVCKIYSMSGGEPNIVLQTSPTVVAASSLTTSLVPHTFEFDKTTSYAEDIAIVFEVTNVTVSDITNYIRTRYATTGYLANSYLQRYNAAVWTDFPSSDLEFDLELESVKATLKGMVYAKGRSDSKWRIKIDSNSFQSISNTSTNKRGQKFEGFNGIIDKAIFKLFKLGSPDHDIVAKIYSISGGFPNAVLQTSTTTIAATSLDGTATEYAFQFDRTTNYSQDIAIVLELESIVTSDGSNYINTRVSTTNRFPNTNIVQYSASWTENVERDIHIDLILVGAVQGQLAQPSMQGTVTTATTTTSVLKAKGRLEGKINSNEHIRETGASGSLTVYSGSRIRLAANFLGFSNNIKTVQFRLSSFGSPDHDIVAKIYSSLGGLPNAVLQTSTTTLAATTLTGTGTWYVFDFDGSTVYNQDIFVVFEIENITLSNISNRIQTSINTDVNDSYAGQTASYTSAWGSQGFYYQDVWIKVTSKSVSGSLTGLQTIEIAGSSDVNKIQNTRDLTGLLSVYDGSAFKVAEILSSFKGGAKSISFSLRKTGSPDHDITAKIYSVSGGDPDTVLQSSTTTIAATSLTVSDVWYDFDFDSTIWYEQDIAVVLEIGNYTVSDNSNKVYFGMTARHRATSITSFTSTWVSASVFNGLFKLNFESVTGTLSTLPVEISGRSDSKWRIEQTISSNIVSMRIGTTEEMGQKIVGFSGTVDTLTFNASKVGSPIHDIEARIYSISGGDPNAVLQTSSNTIAAASLSGTQTDYTFQFDKTTNYSQDIFIGIKIVNVTTSDASNYILGYFKSEKLFSTGNQMDYFIGTWQDRIAFTWYFDLILIGATEGVLEAKGKLYGTVTTASSTVSVLLAQGDLEGAIGNIPTTAGILKAKGKLYGEVTTATTTTSILAGKKLAASDVNTSSTTAGILKAKGKLYGEVTTATSTVSDLTNGVTIGAMASDVNTSSTLAGLLESDLLAEGIITTATSTVSVLTAKGELASSINTSTSTVSVLKAKGVLVSSINTSSSTVSVLAGQGSLQDAIDSVATTAGILKAKGKLYGTITTATTTVSDLQGKLFGAGEINTATSTVSILKAKGKLYGTVTTATTTVSRLTNSKIQGAVTTATTTVSVLKAKGKLYGTVTTATATVSVLTTIGILKGVITTATTTAGIGTLKYNIDASINTATTTASILKASGRLYGTVTTASSTLSDLKAKGKLYGTVTTATSTTSVMLAKMLVASFINTSSTVTAGIQGRSGLGNIPVYESAGTIGATTGTLTLDVPYPATVNLNDILFCVLIEADNDTWDTPTDWNLSFQDGANAQASVAVFWKRADGTETGTETFTNQVSAGKTTSGIMYRYSGCITTGTPYELKVDHAIELGTTHVYTDGGNSTGANRLAIALFGVEDNTMTSITGTGWTQDDITTDATGDDSSLGAASDGLATSGTNPADVTANFSGTDYSGGIVAYLLPKVGGVLTMAIITPSSTVTGTLTNLQAASPIDSSVDTTTTTAGILKAKGKLYGTVTTATTTAGILKSKGKLYGTVTTATSTVSDLTNGVSIGVLASVVNTATTTVSVLKGQGELYGTVTTATTTVSVLKGQGELYGTVTTATSTISVLVGQGSLEDAIDSLATTFGILKAKGKLYGTITTATTTVSDLKAKGELISSINTATTTAGVLKSLGDLAGVINTSTSTESVLFAQGKLIGVVTTDSTLTAILISDAMIGVITTATTTAGILKSKGKLVGIITTATSTVSVLAGQGSLEDIVDSISTTVGVLKAKGELASSTNTSTVLDGVLKSKGVLKSIVTTATTTVGILSSDADTKGVITTATTTQGTLSAKGKLEGAVTTVTSTSGNMAISKLIGVTTTVTATSGILKAKGLLKVVSNTQTTTSAFGSTRQPMIAEIFTSSISSGFLSAKIIKLGVITTATTTSGTLKATGKLEVAVSTDTITISVMVAEGKLKGVITTATTTTSDLIDISELLRTTTQTSTIATGTLKATGTLLSDVSTSTTTASLLDGYNLKGTVSSGTSEIVVLKGAGALLGSTGITTGSKAFLRSGALDVYQDIDYSKNDIIIKPLAIFGVKVLSEKVFNLTVKDTPSFNIKIK